MEGVFAFQRTGAAVSITTTSGASTSSALTIANGGVLEIANTSATVAATFVATDAGASGATAATSSMRAIPPMTVLHERLPQGASYVAAIALAAGAPVIVFTPGVSNG